jgi:hypothetical protein
MSSPSAHDATPADYASDNQLLLRIAQGDQAALGELYDRWCLPLHALATASLSDPGLIEDALHNTFITLWQKAGDFDPRKGSAYDWALGWAQTNLNSAVGTAPVVSRVSAEALNPPSAALRARILNSAVPLPPEIRYILPFPNPPAWIGWVAAALLGVTSLFFAAKSFNVRGELQSAIDAERAAHLEAATLKNLLEAERILSRAQLDRLSRAEQLISELRAQAAPTSDAVKP